MLSGKLSAEISHEKIVLEKINEIKNNIIVREGNTNMREYEDDIIQYDLSSKLQNNI